MCEIYKNFTLGVSTIRMMIYTYIYNYILVTKYSHHLIDRLSSTHVLFFLSIAQLLCLAPHVRLPY